MIHKNRGNRRKKNWQKAMRRKELCIALAGASRFDHDGQYIKSGALCGCPLCRHGKTNKQNYKKLIGPGGISSKNYSPADLRKIVAGKQALAEFYAA